MDDMRIFFVGVLVVGSLAILSGCGSSSSKLSASAFSNAANKICTTENTEAKSAGAGVTATANAASAASLAKLIAISNKNVVKLKALSGPSALESARDTFVAAVNKDAAFAQKAETAAKAGNQAEYIAAAKATNAGNAQTNRDGSKLGAPACATNS
jgi:hypothetical protein